MFIKATFFCFKIEGKIGKLYRFAFFIIFETNLAALTPFFRVLYSEIRKQSNRYMVFDSFCSKKFKKCFLSITICSQNDNEKNIHKKLGTNNFCSLYMNKRYTRVQKANDTRFLEQKVSKCRT